MKHIYTTHMKALFLLIMFFLTQSASLFARTKFALYDLNTWKLIFYTTDGKFYCGNFNTADFNNKNKSFKILVAKNDGIWGSYIDMDADFILDNRITQVNSYLKISSQEDITFCVTIEDGDKPKVTIKEHAPTIVSETPATCSECGYKTMECPNCHVTEKIITSQAIGHNFGEWQKADNGQYRVCGTDKSHIQYNMNADEVAALTFKLNDGSELVYPYTLNPYMTITPNSVEVTFDTDKKVSTIRTADIVEYSANTYHNKNGYHQNDDNTYSHMCDYEDCNVTYDDLFVKNAGEYITAENDNGTIKVGNINLTDAEGYDCKADITVGKVEYKRTMNNRWASLCLPFELSGNIADYEFYELSNVTYETIELKKITGAVTAGTPVLLRRTDKEGSKEFTFTAENVPMVTQANSNVSTIDGLTLTGTFTTIDELADTDYMISHDNFYTVGYLKDNLHFMNTAKIAPFHAYIKQDGSIYNNAKYSLSMGGTTAINVLNAIEGNPNATYYDINGRHIMGLQKGVNIVKNGNITKKIIIK